MIVHANEILCPMNDDDAAAHRVQLEICMNALSDLSKTWLIAELCLGIASPVLDRLQPGKYIG
jgi:predicted xylose isomerase-like sugar epimerase